MPLPTTPISVSTRRPPDSDPQAQSDQAIEMIRTRLLDQNVPVLSLTGRQINDAEVIIWAVIDLTRPNPCLRIVSGDVQGATSRLLRRLVGASKISISVDASLLRARFSIPIDYALKGGRILKREGRSLRLQFSSRELQVIISALNAWSDMTATAKNPTDKARVERLRAVFHSAIESMEEEGAMQPEEVEQLCLSIRAQASRITKRRGASRDESTDRSQ